MNPSLNGVEDCTYKVKDTWVVLTTPKGYTTYWDKDYFLEVMERDGRFQLEDVCIPDKLRLS